jgi:hypothetical protein
MEALMSEWVSIAAVIVGNVSCYVMGRKAGATWMGENIRAAALKVIHRHYPNRDNIPATPETDLDVMCQVLDALVVNIDTALNRTEKR